jgi:cobalt-zinc-cadmium efflux system outer membrane protein
MRRISFILCLILAVETTAQTTPEPAGSITIEEAIRLALARNPAIASAALEIEARSERARQSSRRPNPALTATVENVGADEVSRETTAGVQQLLELGGDRSARSEAALRSRDVAAQESSSQRAAVVGEVRRAFTSVLAGQQEVAIARENLELSQNTATAIRARVEAGKVSPIEETRSDVLVAAERLELARAEQRLGEARRRLAATWGGDRPAFAAAAGELGAGADPPPLETLRSRLDTHPALLRASAVVAEREAIVRLEEARAIPDVTASAGYRRFSSPGDGAFVGSVTVPVPLFDRNRAAVAEARLRVAQAKEESRGIRVRLERDLADAWRAYETTKHEVSTLQSSIVPAAQRVFDAISEGYRLGKFGYLEVLDARRTLTSARLQLARALEQLHLAAASVEQLTTTGETK